VIATKFWRLVDIRDVRSCWAWRGNPHGTFAAGGEMFNTNRFAWSFAYGDIPEGKLVLHSCDNRDCVNPRHLRLGTYADNEADKWVLSRAIAAANDGLDTSTPAPRRRRAPVERRAINDRIRRLRIATGMSQGAFADSIGSSKSCVCEWESGRAAPSGAKLPIVAAALGVTVADLFAELEVAA
jgi:DNA-binding transcriptional regulator YiaG